jgi:hypothetical protein
VIREIKGSYEGKADVKSEMQREREQVGLSVEQWDG